jgi:hypothetical protein
MNKILAAAAAGAASVLIAGRLFIGGYAAHGATTRKVTVTKTVIRRPFRPVGGREMP